MLYRIKLVDDKYYTLELSEFKDFTSFGNLEKDLEEMIASNILEVLFEEASLMPIFRERKYQAEADIYALNEKGNLVIFELKRGVAGKDAVHQALRYVQDAGKWTFSILQNKYQQYTKSEIDLRLAHKEAFNLEHQLEANDFNQTQHIIIIGSAADDSLVNAVDYWKRQGISIEFLPYRIYDINGEKYFEFFALPYDKHRNPSEIKGILFDTNRSYDEDAIWYMMENSVVAAFGDATRFIEYIYPGDIVFFSHKWTGLIAAGRVKKGNIKKDNNETWYRDIEFLTAIPEKGKEIKAMPFQRVCEIMGKRFFWARTIKVPYLSKDEAEILLKELQIYLKKSE